LPQPLKRHPALQPLSREHHQILLLGFKIRQGLKNNIDHQRIVDYCIWFYSSFHLQHVEHEAHHFEHILGKHSEIYVRLKQNHKNVIHAFKDLKSSYLDLKTFEELIVSHVREEERVLYQELQAQLTPEAIHYLETNLTELDFHDRFKDIFWQ